MLNIDLSGRRALVTGGNSGIGAAIVASLAAAGADVAINYIGHPEAAEAGAAAVRAAGPRALTIAADVSDADAVAAMFARIDSEWGGLDILVNNAGIGTNGNSATLSLEDFRKVMDVNLYGAFLGTKVCAPAIAKRSAAHPGRGSIINVSSMSSYMPYATSLAYNCSKSALRMLTMCTSKELGPHGIRVNSVHPGPIVTPLLREAFHRYADAGMYASAEDAEQRIAASSPLGRTGKPEELAHRFVYLASDDACYVTGTAIAHDGGVGSVF